MLRNVTHQAEIFKDPLRRVTALVSCDFWIGSARLRSSPPLHTPAPDAMKVQPPSLSSPRFTEMPPLNETPVPESFDDWLYDPPALPTQVMLPAWAWWVIGCVAAALMIFALLKLRKRLLIPKDPKEPRVEALRALYNLRARVETFPPSAMGTALATALNRYLHRRYGALAEFRTRDELFVPASRPTGCPPLPPGVADRFASLMARFEEMRFAGRKTDVEARRKTVVATLKAMEGEPA